MATRNTTTRSTGRTRQASQTAFEELAAHIAAILTNPHTPEGLGQALSDAVIELQTAVWDTELNTPQMIARALAYEAGMKGGA